MAITVDATSTATSGSAETGNTTLTWSHTNAGDFMRVGVSWRSDAGQTVSGITYNGVALTQIGTAAVNGSTSAGHWRLIAPASGAHNVVVTLSADTAALMAGATTYSGVDQTTPTGTSNTATGNSTTPTVDIASVSGDIVVDVVAGSPVFTLDSAGAGQTAEWNISDSGAQFRRGGGSRETATTTTTTMSWSVSTASTWAIHGVALKAAAASNDHTGTAVGHAGAEGTDAGASARASAVLARTGARGITAGTTAIPRNILGSAGARGTCTGQKNALSFNVGGVGQEGQSAGASARTSATTGHAGARGQALGAPVSVRSAFGHAGARATCAGIKAGTAASTGSAGTRGIAAGAKAGSTASIGRVGCRAVTVGISTRSGTSVGQAGARGVNVGAVNSIPPTSRDVVLRARQPVSKWAFGWPEE